MARINMYLLLKEVSKMSKTVGIPKGLLYYDFYPMWKTFLKVWDQK